MTNSTKPLNVGQQAAGKGFYDFLFSPEKEFRISGPAGVGKTYLMGHMIDEIMPQYIQTCQLLGIKEEYDEVMMTATTNKAADVVGLATGRPSSTIHSFMNLKVVDDYKTGRSNITKSRNWKVHEGKIIFIDEAYTIDSQLLQYIREGTHKCKIVYVGDKCQLPPVMEKESPIANIPAPLFELDEPMRNADQPALKALCDQLRQQVITGTFGDIQRVPGVVDVYNDAEMEDALRNGEFINSPSARVLAYTNSQVIAFNDFIRAQRKLGPDYTVGETLVNTTGMQMKDRMLSAEQELTIISLSNRAIDVPIGDGATMKVIGATVEDAYKDQFHIDIPVDRDHYFQLIAYFKGKKNWERFYHLRNNYPDLRPRDASTVHKAQGSSFDTVYIDLSDLSTCNRPDIFARLMYVGASRPRKRVVFYNELASKYGKIIM